MTGPGPDRADPEDPAFWDAWGRQTSDWDALSARERAVMAHAADEGALSEIMLYFTGGPGFGDAFVSNMDRARIRLLMPDFSRIIVRLVSEGRIEVREMPAADSDWEDGQPLYQERLAEVLADPASWSGVTDANARQVRIELASRPPRKRLIRRSTPTQRAEINPPSGVGFARGGFGDLPDGVTAHEP
ncbi:MAG: hypothetical protein J2P29_03005 [Actinobacteria bacterium]|nr:hypothetical protein [Actinomycetota bacterium]